MVYIKDYLKNLVLMVIDLIHYILLINLKPKATAALIVAKWRFSKRIIKSARSMKEMVCVVSILLMSITNHPLVLNILIIYPLLLEYMFTGFLDPNYVRYLVYVKAFLTLQYFFMGLLLEVLPLKVKNQSYLKKKYPIGVLVNFRKSLDLLKRLL